MLRTIHLHGALAEQFGPSFRLSVSSPAEAVRALVTQLPGLDRAIADGSFRCIVRGDRRKPVEIGEAHKLLRPWGDRDTEFHLVPAVQGAGGNGGAAKIIVGVLIIVAAIVAPYALGAFAAGGLGMGASAIGVAGVATFGQIAAMGAMIALGGIAMMISPQAKAADAGTREAADQRQSFMFNGPVNSVEQGGPVPLIYGEVITGSHVIGLDLVQEDLPPDAPPQTKLTKTALAMVKTGAGA